MNKFEEFKYRSSGKLRRWIKKVQSLVGDIYLDAYDDNNLEVMSCLLDEDGDSADTEEEKDENIGIIMKTLRDDVMDIVRDVESQKKPSRVIYKLDTLENNIRETCILKNNSMGHTVIHEEVLKAQEKYIVNLIEEIMDDVFQAWNNMKKRKKLGTERSINSVVNVLRVLKKEVCRLLNVLRTSNTPNKTRSHVKFKSKSFNDSMSKSQERQVVWKKNIEYHCKETNEINVCSSKSFPMCSPKVSYNVNENFRFVETLTRNKPKNFQDNLLSISSQEVSDIMLQPDNIGYKQRCIEDNVDKPGQNEALIYSQYAHDAKSTLQNVLSKLVRKKPPILGKSKVEVTRIAKSEKELSGNHESKLLNDASTWTEPDSTTTDIYPHKKDSQCNTVTSFPCNIEISSISNYMNKTKNYSDKLFADKIAWLKTIGESKPDERTTSSGSLGNSESLPAIDLINTSSSDISKLQPNIEQSSKISKTRTNEYDVSVSAGFSVDSDSDESYVSCAPSTTQYSLRRIFNNLNLNNANKSQQTDNFCCKSRKLSELKRKVLVDRPRRDLVIKVWPRKSEMILNTVHIQNDRPEIYTENGYPMNCSEYCTLAFMDEKPAKLHNSFSPDMSMSSIDPHINDDPVTSQLSTENNRNNNNKISEEIPLSSYLSDSQFSNICLSTSGNGNLEYYMKKNNSNRNFTFINPWNIRHII